MEGVANRLEEIAFVAITYQMGENLGVGFRMEMMAFALKPGADGAVVFDDPVVDQRDPARLVKMRVGIDFGRRTVGGPAGVGDARGRVAKPLVGPIRMGALAEIRHLAGRLGDDDPAAIQNGESRGIITAVFKPSQAVDEDGGSVRLAYVSYDATHVRSGVGCPFGRFLRDGWWHWATVSSPDRWRC